MAGRVACVVPVHLRFGTHMVVYSASMDERGKYVRNVGELFCKVRACTLTPILLTILLKKGGHKTGCPIKLEPLLKIFKVQHQGAASSPL
jgi:hypothetical protein